MTATGPAAAQTIPDLPVGTAIAGAGLVVALAMVVLAIALARAIGHGSRRVEDGVDLAARQAQDDAAATRQSQKDDLEALRSAARHGREAVEQRLDELISTVRGRSRDDAMILAESLTGELQAVQTALETHLVRLDAHLTERAEAGYSKVAMRDLLPRVGAPVFTAQAGNIGLLGGSLAGDLAWVHGCFQAWMNLESSTTARQTTIALDEAQEAMEAIEDVREGVLHLIHRLLGFIDDTPVSPSARALVNDRVTARAEALLSDEDEDDDALPDTTDDTPPDDETPSTRPPVDDVRLSGPTPSR